MFKKTEEDINFTLNDFEEFDKCLIHFIVNNYKKLDIYLLYDVYKMRSKQIYENWHKEKWGEYRGLIKIQMKGYELLNYIYENLSEFDKKLLSKVYETIDDVYCLRGSKFLSNHYFEDNIYDKGISYVIKDILSDNQLLHDFKNLIDQGAFKK